MRKSEISREKKILEIFFFAKTTSVEAVFCFFAEFSKEFCIFFKFRILSQNRLKRNFSEKAKILAFFASERDAKKIQKFSRKIFPFRRNP